MATSSGSCSSAVTLTGDYDIVLAHRLDHTPPWPPGVSVTALLHEPLDVAMQENHPLASKQRVTPHDVAGEQWITVHDGFPLFGTIEAIGAAAGRRLNIVHRGISARPVSYTHLTLP